VITPTTGIIPKQKKQNMKRHFIILPSVFFLVLLSSQINSQTQYVCTPCGDCDTLIFDKPGKCPACEMDLVDKYTVKHVNIKIPDVCELVKNNKDIIILDVRSKEEFEGTHKTRKEGRLNGAINININELEKRLGEIEAYKDREIIVYCSHAHRSQRASHYLSQNGFTNVKNMLEGISAWENYDSPCSKELYVK
jgi:rhodanese-related sulfurtransferase